MISVHLKPSQNVDDQASCDVVIRQNGGEVVLSMPNRSGALVLQRGVVELLDEFRMEVCFGKELAIG